MRVLIEKVEPNVVNREDPKMISSFWIYGLLRTGRKERIFDSETFDLRKYEKLELNLLILCKLSNIPDDALNGDEQYYPVLEGEYLGEYNIPDNWKIGWRFEPIKKERPVSFHAIQTKDGILMVKPKNLKYYSIKPGDIFKFKVTGFDLIAWEPIEGEREIDPLAYEKNFIEKFWNLIESTREKCNNDPELQKELIYMALLEWSYDEIWLFGDIVNHLSNALRFDTILKGLFKKEVNKWGNFCRGIVALGRTPFNEAISNLAKFSHDINTGVYGESPKKIESSLYTLVQDVVEEKSDKTIYDVEELYLREDIDDYQQRIYEILDKEHNLNWESD